MRLKSVMIVTTLLIFTLAGSVYASPDSSASASVQPTVESSAATEAVASPTAAVDENEYEPLSLGSSGSNVISLQMRLRDLGYYDYKITGHYGAITAAAVREFQKTNGIPDTGTAANMTFSVLYTNNAIRKDVSSSSYDAKLGRDGIAETAAPDFVPQYGQMLDWFTTVQYLIPRGTKFKITDFNTGISWTMIRTGGYNHADSEPATKADTKQMKRVYKYWSWTRRAVLVTINGKTIAASMNGMPHAFDRNPVDNGMNGHVCVHFLNSRTHIRNLKDPDHQRMVKRAAGK